MTNYHFDIYNEANRINGNIAVEFTAIANSESEVKEMAENQGFNIDGYTLINTGKVCDQLGRSYSSKFEREF